MTGTPFCAVVPAAGCGRRMGGGGPKQYLPLCTRTVIEHSLQPLLDHPDLKRLVVVVAEGDSTFRSLSAASDDRVLVVTGGSERADSVAAGLSALDGEPPETLVLVHDAARPCVSRAEVDRLVTAAGGEEGALLALPVRDTLKRDRGDGHVGGTVNRDGLWQALTPQAFRLGVLRKALTGNRDGITDEASAMERAGHSPRLVEGDAGNVKVTWPGDLAVAAAILVARGEQDA